MVDPSREDFMTGGLADRAAATTFRVVVLPADPEAVVLRFDEEFQRCWRTVDPSPEDVQVSWPYDTGLTAHAAARFSRTNEGWGDYVAVHRHGGEAASDAM
jgi:hypothetical protein